MLDARRRACLDAMGIDLWRLAPARPGERQAQGMPPVTDRLADGAPNEPTAAVRTTAGTPASDPDVITALPIAAQRGISPGPESLDWDALRSAVVNCHACALDQTRTQTVFGVGDHQAPLMVIGEAPGADEDRLGEPFVGRAGQLLTAMLAAIGFTREQVYIANIIKCRPPGNRDPHTEEAAACQPFLHRQIALIQPQVILSVGRISAHNLLGTEEAVGRLRGRTHRFEPGDIPLIVTYHPAYLLRRPQEKAKAWQDLQRAHRLLNGA